MRVTCILLVWAIFPVSGWLFESSPGFCPRLVTRTSNGDVGSTVLTENAAEDTPPKVRLQELLAQAPPNRPTPHALTRKILATIQTLECPTSDEDILPNLAGSWDLLWTTQDRASPEANSNIFRSWINPLENQAYSNNPQGRSNPFLPQRVQDRLENLGVVRSTPTQSTQTIDIDQGRVRNVVAFTFRERRAALTVDISFEPVDARKIAVQFQACRLVVPGTPIDAILPLGFLGPSGWLRTDYMDENLRITRGHKGSVFVLTRSRSRGSSKAAP